MRKLFLHKYHLLFLILFIHLASCSWITDFVVSNKSDISIELSYRFKKWKSQANDSLICPDLKKIGYPLVTSERNLKRSNNSWEKIETENFAYEKSSCKVSYVLLPGHSARITTMGTYTGHREGSDDFFFLDTLSVKTKHGFIEYRDFELLKQFKKQSKSLYIYEYK